MPPNPSPPMSIANSTNPTSANAFLAHLLSQTRSNIDFLVTQGYITQREAAGIGARLRTLQEEAETEVEGDRTGQTANEGPGLEVRARAPSPPKAVLPVARRNVLPPPSSSASSTLPLQQAKALWDYNVDGSDANDLSFRAGDIIEIVTETNADWWTGRLANRNSAREGLFPSNYVEKIAAQSPARPVPIPEPTPRPVSSISNFSRNSNIPPSRFPSHASLPAPPYSHSPNNAYQAPAPWAGRPPPPPHNYGGPAYSGYNGNEKQEGYAVAPPQPPPQAGPVAPPPQEPPQPEKQGKFGGLGNTMAQSAAGGVGFGAGAAIGSGIINAIF